MGLFSVLGTATRGLSASQLGMEVTGQNISNADVEGYSRKRLTTAAAYRYDDHFGQMGYGVEVINIERVRNTYLDQQIRRQTHEVGYYEELDHTLEAVENIFTEPGETGLLHFIDQFFDSWENLANNPTDIAARTMVKTNAQVLTDVFHNAGSELYDLRQTRNDEIGTRIERVNQILNELHNLNREIAAVETNNQKANDSRDRRDVILKELSSLIDIETRENHLGQITVTTQGNILVSPVDIQELELSESSFTQADGAKRPDIAIRFSNSKREYIPGSGQIRGLLDSRDTIIPRYREQLDHLAVSLVERINEVHESGYSMDGYSGLSFFDPNTTGATDIAIAPGILSNVQNIAAAQAGETRGTTENITHTYGNDPVDLLHRDLLAETITVTNQGSGVVLTEGVDYHIDYARGTFQLLTPTHDGAALSIEYQYTTGGFRGAGDNANAIAISELRHQLTMVPDVVGNMTSTFDQYYASFIGSLGLARTEAGSNLETREFLVQQYESHQDSIAGVSLDEEMAEMIKFQHSYQAAARIISTASQMLEVLMNM